MNTSSTAVSIRDVSKSYKLYQSPVHRVKETFHPFRKKYNTIFHALKNISVEIGWGETIGIVGRNGCGKSTLLQIVCGIMPPTLGQLQVNGRISAILELGAGFNPEFSGRDNVYLNCSILGMKRSEVDERIGDILEFADIDEFIDQPVKSYSSGMSVRLAFSIAINVDPQILVIDEALAVGDAAFQRKCFSRINSIQEQGATILFVSHDAGAVVELCTRAMLLDQGELLYLGSPKKVIALYHKLLFAPHDKVASIRESILDKGYPKSVTSDVVDNNTNSQQNVDDLPGQEKETSKPFLNPGLRPQSTIWYEPNGAIIEKPFIQTLNGTRVNVLVRNEEYFYTYKVRFTTNAFNVRYGMLIKTLRGLELGGAGNRVEDIHSGQSVKKGSVVHVKLRFYCRLLPGLYFMNAGVMAIENRENKYLHRGVDVVMFEVMQEDNIGATALVDFGIETTVSFETLGDM